MKIYIFEKLTLSTFRKVEPYLVHFMRFLDSNYTVISQKMHIFAKFGFSIVNLMPNKGFVAQIPVIQAKPLRGGKKAMF